MTTTLPLAQARAQLSRLVDSATDTHERFDITRNGRRAAVLLSADDFDTLQETLAVLADADLMEQHRLGREALAVGDWVSIEQLREDLRAAAGRPAE